MTKPPISSLWNYIWFRELAFWAARAAGKSWRWITTGWRGLTLLTAGVVLAWWVWSWLWAMKRPETWLARFLEEFGVGRRVIGDRGPDLFELLTFAFWLKVVLAVAAILLLLEFARARRRFVILPAANFAGEEFTSHATGLPRRLATELRRLGDLYKEIDEANPRIEGKEALPKIEVEGEGKALELIAAAEADIQLGPVKLPLGRLVSAIGRLAQGPRLSSSLHRSGNQFTLTAQLESRAGSGGSWSIARTLPGTASAQELRQVADDMLEELLYGVFTNTGNVGSSAWKAVRSFSKGLRAYRRTLRSDRDKRLNLRRAERHFIKARGHDRSFARCSYNLGIAYRDLNIAPSERASFEAAIIEDPSLGDAAYALALIDSRDGAVDQLDRQADSLRVIDPKDARAWIVKTWVWMLRKESELQRKLGAIDSAGWAELATYRLIPVALLWRELCAAALHGKSLDAANQQLELAFQNLAVAHAFAGRLRLAIAEMRQALRRSRSHTLHFELAKMLCARSLQKHWKEASAEYRQAILLCPEDSVRALYCTQMASDAAILFKQKNFLEAAAAANEAFALATECPSCLTPNVLDKLESACDDMNWADKKAELAQYREVTGDPGLTGLDKSELEKRLTTYDAAQRVWASAMVSLELAKRVLDLEGGDPARAADRIWEAIGKFNESGKPKEIARQRANSFLADAYNRQRKFADALEAAQHAVAVNPWDSAARRSLGEAYRLMGDFDRAEEALRASFELDPKDEMTLHALAFVYWDRGATRLSREARRAEFEQVIKLFDNALLATQDRRTAGWLHFWLGRFHGELGRFDQAVQHLSIAKAGGARPLEGRFWLAWAFFNKEFYDDAEWFFREVLGEEKAFRRRGAWFLNKAPGEDDPIGYILVVTHMYLAGICTERGDFAQARRWLKFVARNRAKFLANDPKDRDAVRRKNDVEGNYFGCLGWLEYREGRPLRALTTLTRSQRVRADPECFYHLARVNLDLAERSKTGRARRLREAHELCRKARAADLQGLFDDRVADIEYRVTQLLA